MTNLGINAIRVKLGCESYFLSKAQPEERGMAGTKTTAFCLLLSVAAQPMHHSHQPPALSFRYSSLVSIRAALRWKLLHTCKTEHTAMSAVILAYRIYRLSVTHNLGDRNGK